MGFVTVIAAEALRTTFVDAVFRQILAFAGGATKSMKSHKQSLQETRNLDHYPSGSLM